jgi:hypothetical protein
MSSTAVQAMWRYRVVLKDPGDTLSLSVCPQLTLSMPLSYYKVQNGFKGPRPAWSAGLRSSTFGYITIHATAESFNVSYLDSRDDAVLDHFSITKG